MRTKIGLSRFLRSKDKSFTASNSSTSSINEGSVNGSSVGDLTPEPVLSFPDGVQQLYTCTDATVDICFVHGLSGNRTSTWTARGAVEPWIKTLLPGVIDKARILTYGYDAYPMSKSVASSNRLIDHASNLLNDITMNRTDHGSNQRPLIFVAHSLGGLVCKKALLQSRHHPEAHLRDVFNSTKGVIFMGTPHKGAWMAKWGNISATALGLIKSTNTSLLEILETDNQLLESIQVDFVSMVRELRESGRNLEITCFFEELPLRGIGLVVPKDSAQLPGHNSLSIHADHSSMVKFSSAEENGFQRVAGELKRWQLSASVTQNLGFILRDLRIIHDMFGSSQQAAVAQVKITAEYDTAFKNDVLKITSFRMQWEAACVALVKGLPDQQCRELMCGQGDWNSLKLQTMIQIKLADGFFSFEKSSSRLQKHVATMRSKLIVWDSMSVSSEEDFPEDDCSIFIDRWTSIQRGRSSKKYSELLRRISEDISDLSRKVLGDEQAQETLRTRRPSQTAMKYWLEIQGHTKRLFNRLTSAVSQGCLTHGHQARLQLSPPEMQGTEIEVPEFRYSFWLDPKVLPHPQQTGLWRDVAVVSFPTPESAAPQSPKLTTKKTRFDLSPNDLSKPLRSCSSEVEIFNLCDALTQDCGKGCCLGLLPHGEWHYHVHDTACKDRELESVGDILPYKGGKNMTTIERRAIALALATGVLQLFDTPWLRDRWSINDIYVDKREQACLFVMMELDAPLKQDPTERKNHQSLLVHPNPRLFALAVALLELTYGAPLSSFREKGDGDDDFTELRIADRLTQKIKDREYGAFTSVVYRCMRPVSDDYEYGLANEGFRRRYVKDILIPLQQEYEDCVSRRRGVRSRNL